jgi:hypothetical protein
VVQGWLIGPSQLPSAVVVGLGISGGEFTLPRFAAHCPLAQSGFRARQVLGGSLDAVVAV